MQLAHINAGVVTCADEQILKPDAAQRLAQRVEQRLQILGRVQLLPQKGLNLAVGHRKPLPVDEQRQQLLGLFPFKHQRCAVVQHLKIAKGMHHQFAGGLCAVLREGTQLRFNLGDRLPQLIGVDGLLVVVYK